MEKQQELEWAEAQKIIISEDLLVKAKQQLLFLAEVDRNRCLYGGSVLERATFRYKYCWLPLLAKHVETPMTQEPLVVPLDCEWIWHCHRLNPVRYKSDCMDLYGRILDDLNVVSSILGTSNEESEKIWNTMYPSEPYELHLDSDSFQDFDENLLGDPESTTKYDLISAVKRQTTFFYQVSRPYWNDDTFLEGAVARYKGFLYLIKRNKERSMRRFCVPTYDVDLIWHSHQLHPASYCKDLVAIMGKVLEHDDTDSDRSKGQKLDVGFFETTNQWEETFGTRYWKAGAMHRGNPPSPLTFDKFKVDAMQNDWTPSNKNQNLIQLPQKMLVEVMLEIVDVRDLPSGHKGKLVVSFKKKQEDILFNAKKQLSISSQPEGKQVAVFQCESRGELVLELIYRPCVNFRMVRPAKVLGKTSINLEDSQNAACKLPLQKWLDLTSAVKWSEPISICVGLSLTPPVPASYKLQMVSTRPSIRSYAPFLPWRKFQQTKNWTNVVDEAGNEIINIHSRNLTTEKSNTNIKLEVVGTTASDETHLLAELKGTTWSMMNSDWTLQRKKSSDEDENVFELTGTRKVIIFPGRKLEFETRYYGNERGNCFLTAVEFSPKDPYGKAVALMNLAYGFLEIKEEWLVLPAILSAFVLSNFPHFSDGIQNGNK
ncbi:glycine-rich domain-containing protein 1-like [Arachis stenosperma]|uniref:glycine-rich domain-containing protein 1-like n=1 Tax=Arachis stenosperma TaxID=217475 RepID=UPI0025ACD790|nr:glycine-rich domain-containing protein 1-like [Arachis stenosperma]